MSKVKQVKNSGVFGCQLSSISDQKKILNAAHINNENVRKGSDSTMQLVVNSLTEKFEYKNFSFC